MHDTNCIDFIQIIELRLVCVKLGSFVLDVLGKNYKDPVYTREDGTVSMLLVQTRYCSKWFRK